MFILNYITLKYYIIMDNQDYNKAERAVDNTEDTLRNTANEAKWKVSDLADKARDYINEKRNNDQEATQEDWLERVKANASDTWEDIKDGASEAWEKNKRCC